MIPEDEKQHLRILPASQSATMANVITVSPQDVISYASAWAMGNLAKREDCAGIVLVGSVTDVTNWNSDSDVDIVMLSWSEIHVHRDIALANGMRIEVHNYPLHQCFTGVLTGWEPFLVCGFHRGVVVHDPDGIGVFLKGMAGRIYAAGPLFNQTVRASALERCRVINHRLMSLAKGNCSHDAASIACSMFLSDIMHLYLTLRNQWDEGHRKVANRLEESYPDVLKRGLQVLGDTSVPEKVEILTELLREAVMPLGEPASVFGS